MLPEGCTHDGHAWDAGIRVVYHSLELEQVLFPDLLPLNKMMSKMTNVHFLD